MEAREMFIIKKMVYQFFGPFNAQLHTKFGLVRFVKEDQ
jgi:hypothetical protein